MSAYGIAALSLIPLAILALGYLISEPPHKMAQPFWGFAMTAAACVFIGGLTCLVMAIGGH